MDKEIITGGSFITQGQLKGEFNIIICDVCY